MTRPRNFWKTKSLSEMNREEWESLCDGCGRCCLHKLRHEDTDEISFTNVSCRLLDGQTCRCRNYTHRQEIVPDCISLTYAMLEEIDWLPSTCAYRRLYEGKNLPWWHPLVTGDPESTHKAGMSVRGRAIDEREAGPLEHHIVNLPVRAQRPLK